MLIAQLKREENIAEYILYMWQVEDMIRACNFDIEIINQQVVERMSEDPEVRKEIRKWYADLISKMKLQGLKESGHLREYNEIFVELGYLHSTLIDLMGDDHYKGIYQKALPLINEFKAKMNAEKMNDVEACLSGLYMKLMLRLKGESISSETDEAFTAFAQVMGYLSAKYTLMKEGKLA